MKQFIKFTTIIAVMICYSFNALAQYGQSDPAGVFVHASAGMSFKTEMVYELEVGIKAEQTRLFISIPGSVYNAKTANDRRSHFYYGIRLNYLIYTGEFAAISPLASYLRHQTGEAGKNQNNDWDAGIRFYKFSTNPGARSAAWTVTARYLHTKSNVYEDKGTSTFEPGNRFIVSIGIHGLF